MRRRNLICYSAALNGAFLGFAIVTFISNRLAIFQLAELKEKRESRVTINEFSAFGASLNYEKPGTFLSISESVYLQFSNFHS